MNLASYIYSIAGNTILVILFLIFMMYDSSRMRKSKEDHSFDSSLSETEMTQLQKLATVRRKVDSTIRKCIIGLVYKFVCARARALSIVLIIFYYFLIILIYFYLYFILLVRTLHTDVGVKTIISATMGAIASLILWSLEVKFYIFWGILTFFFNCIIDRYFVCLFV